MRFFWILIIITMASVAFYLIFFNGLELVILLLIVDFIVLMVSNELGKDAFENKTLSNKIENLEKLTYDLFNKLTGRQNDKEQLTKWLEEF